MAKRILIVDDEDHIRRVMRMTLEAAGYEAGEAADGLRGLEAFGDGSGWDAVLLDQKMPVMDGLETLRHMKERDPAARIVMVTAYASIELAVDAMKLGATDFVRKPMTPEIVRNAVTAALSKPVAVTSAPDPGVAAPTTAPPVSRLTLNGFRFWPESDPDWQRREPGGRRFIVQHPDGHEQQVVVEFETGSLAVIERAAHAPLPFNDAFWTALAERCLNKFLWNEGKIPVGAKLTIGPAGIDSDALRLASDWKG
ncbi:MAG TPA: response regulator [Candidatus Baltobacteraceae bacterium]|nr:response regulator [Candidatus Baltobacteraceae bacterium]